MRRSRAECAVVLGLLLAANGCTALREIPREDYGQVRERHGVRVETRDGLVYEFDYASFTADSLTGYRNRSELDGPVDQTVALRMALDVSQQQQARSLELRAAISLARLLHASGRTPGGRAALQERLTAVKQLVREL